MSPDDFGGWWWDHWERLKRFVQGLLRRYGRPVDAAEDILQQAVVSALCRARLGEIDPDRCSAFVFWWVRKRFLDWLRRETRRERHEAQSGREEARRKESKQARRGVSERQTPAFHQQELRRALLTAGLSERERLAIVAWLEAGGDRQEAMERFARAAEGKGIKVQKSSYDQAKHSAKAKLSGALAPLAGRSLGYDCLVSALRHLHLEDG